MKKQALLNKKLCIYENKKCYTFFCVLLVLVFFSPVLIAEQNQQSKVPLQDTKINELNQQDDNESSGKKSYSFLTEKTGFNVQNNIKKNETSVSADALSVSLGLIFILFLIFSMAWFLRKMGYSNMTGQGQLKVVATLNFGQKEKIALIQVGKQQLLVGMTATQINTLHVLNEAIEETEIKQAENETGQGNNHFAEKLSSFIKK